MSCKSCPPKAKCLWGVKNLELWLELTTEVLMNLQKCLTPKKRAAADDSQPQDAPSPPSRKRRRHLQESPKMGPRKPRTTEERTAEGEPTQDGKKDRIECIKSNVIYEETSHTLILQSILACLWPCSANG